MIKAKKSLGQNFLIDKNVIDKIINIVSITDNEILEVGPGSGNLTKEILRNNPSKMYLVEKDTFLAESLKDVIDERVKIFNEDILKFDENLISKKKNYSIWELAIQYFNRNIKYMDYKVKK